MSWRRVSYAATTSSACLLGPAFPSTRMRPRISRRSRYPLIGVPALEYIDALVKAGYDGIGLRMYLDRMMPSLEFTAKLGFAYVLAICDGPDWNRQVVICLDTMHFWRV